MEDLYEKGNLLLKSALKKYEEGKYEEGDKDREMANQFYDKAKNDNIEGQELDSTSLYGESRNFGIIYKVIIENIKKNYNTKNGRKFINEFVRLTKSNKLLKEQLNIYNTFSNVTVDEVDDYLNEAIDLIPSFNKKDVKKVNESLIKLIRKYNIDETIDISDRDMDLFESIEYVLFNKKNINNIIDYNNNINILKENIKDRQTKSEKIITEDDYNKNLNSVIESLQTKLNDDEFNLLKELNEGDKKMTFDKYKKETLEYITEQISNSSDVNEKIDWNNILMRINLKQFNESKLLEDVLSFINIKNIINDV